MTEQTIATLPGGAGSYVLVMYLSDPRRVRIGALGWHDLGRGYYLYVGSALGGLRARLARYLRGSAHQHWHIDYFLPTSRLDAIWYLEHKRHLECQWAARLGAIPEVELALADFGSSDCHCPAHLFTCVRCPQPGWLREPSLQTLQFHPQP
ncbi:MAG: GIY-YIG nuclease family protein [Anaerolineae bacterium]|nr:GIY-YIG nuclease family protein [Chloroflexota bacterium]